MATIRVSGGSSDLSEKNLDSLDKLFAAANGRPLHKQPLSRVVFGEWGCKDPLEELVVVRNASSVEIHCHGGSVCVKRVLSDLEDIGFAAHVDSEMSLSETLGHVVTLAPTLQTAQHLLVQQRLWPKWIESLSALETTDAIQSECEKSLAWASFGLHLTEPWQVAIVGEPNVGKSTLLNALLGFDRSIVFDQPGTTRDVVSARTVFAGWPVLLSDTAGIREADDAIEATGVTAARTRADLADLRLHVTDLTDPTTTELQFVGETLLIGNKADAVADNVNHVDFAVSATTGSGLSSLIDGVVAKLVPQVSPRGQCVPVSVDLVSWLNSIVEACRTQDLNVARRELQAWQQ